MEGVSEDRFDLLSNDIIDLIFSAISDCKSLVRCMAVSKGFRRHASRVSSLSIICQSNFVSYEVKLQNILNMVKEFKHLENLVVRVVGGEGEPREDLLPSWTRCMRYAEMGDSVEKFVFMAAKTGDFFRFDSIFLRSNFCYGRNKSRADKEKGRNQYLDSELNLREFNLRQVVTPNSDVIKRMLPVIHFAALQGLTELKDSLPAFVSHFPELRRLVLVDMTESITFHLRDHHIEEMRAFLRKDFNKVESNLEGGFEKKNTGQSSGSMEVFRKQQRDLEMEALSFDYTFWKAERFAALDYCLSDLSMCIATQSARPLLEAEMDILISAALAGPLLVATISLVNKQYAVHNL